MITGIEHSIKKIVYRQMMISNLLSPLQWDFPSQSLYISITQEHGPGTLEYIIQSAETRMEVGDITRLRLQLQLNYYHLTVTFVSKFGYTNPINFKSSHLVSAVSIWYNKVTTSHSKGALYINLDSSNSVTKISGLFDLLILIITFLLWGTQNHEHLWPNVVIQKVFFLTHSMLHLKLHAFINKLGKYFINKLGKYKNVVEFKKVN